MCACVWRPGDSGLKTLKEEACPLHWGDVWALLHAHAAWIGEDKEGNTFCAQTSGLCCGFTTVFTRSKALWAILLMCLQMCSPSQEQPFLAYPRHLLSVFNPVAVFLFFSFFMLKQNFCLDFIDQRSIK